MRQPKETQTDFMTFLGYSDLSKAISKRIKRDMRKSEETWTDFMTFLGISDLSKSISKEMK